MLRKYLIALFKEHEHGMVHINFIRDAVDRINENGINKEDIKILEDSIAFVAKDVMEHCKNEEIVFYPKLSGIVPEISIQRMKSEHIKLLSSVCILKELLSGIRLNGKGVEKRLLLHEQATGFINMLSTHIQEENKILCSIMENNLAGMEIKKNK